jgi:hypothetical protein
MSPMSDGTACERALANLSRLIDASLAFPKNVFRGGWGGFFFFDSDWIFEGPFVERAKALLKIEGGQCASLCNLDEPYAADRSSFFIHKNVGTEEFHSFLRGPRPGDGWIHRVDRFGCTSDLGQWCIYCERRNEIAVIAIREKTALANYRAVTAEFKAMPIGDAISLPLSYGFSSVALSVESRDELMKQYANSRE